MKAELTRNIIDKHVPKTLFKGEHENFELQHVYAELDRIEEDAKVGRALLESIKNGFGIFQWTEYAGTKETWYPMNETELDRLMKWEESKGEYER